VGRGMLRAHIQDHGSILAGLQNGCGIQVGHLRFLAVALHRIILAQRVAFPILRHEDTP